MGVNQSWFHLDLSSSCSLWEWIRGESQRWASAAASCGPEPCLGCQSVVPGTRLNSLTSNFPSYLRNLFLTSKGSGQCEFGVQEKDDPIFWDSADTQGIPTTRQMESAFSLQEDNGSAMAVSYSINKHGAPPTLNLARSQLQAEKIGNC